MPGSVTFGSSPSLADSKSYSYGWPSRYRPANDGSCTENVAVSVLDKYGIAYTGSIPSYGSLCGLDINNMDAESAILLSLAENMKANTIYELHADEDGFAFFKQVYPTADTANLDIRLCVPTSSINNKVDLVIVQGYDTPPVRYTKAMTSVKWLETDSLANYAPTCPMYATEAWRSYKDPVLETQYMDGVENLYELKAFEQLVGYVVKIDGDNDPTVSYSFSDSSVKNVELTAGHAYGGVVEVCDEQARSISTVSYAGYSYALGNYSTRDKFGTEWPLFLNVQGVYAVVYEVTDVALTAAAGGRPASAWYTVNPKRNFISLPTSNWHWDLNTDSSPTIHVYYRVPDETDSNYFTVGGYESAGWRWTGETSYGSSGLSPGDSLGGIVMPNMGGSWVSLIVKMWAAIELDRPSVTVSAPKGNAISLANSFDLAYQPIIVKDEPPPVAYTFGGAAQLVDHTLDLYDSDPSTVQAVPSSLVGSMSWLQTHTTGRTINISLPFCDADETKVVAQTIFETHNEEVTTYNLVCGPSSTPVLGDKVDGMEGRINKITYSYSDASSYTINVGVGPTFVSPKSWSTTIWQRKTEDVSREAIVTWSAGDGVNYRVNVRGLGSYHAINKTTNVFNPGEKVSVTVHNNPKEQ